MVFAVERFTGHLEWMTEFACRSGKFADVPGVKGSASLNVKEL
jgi:hypothetical protein